MEQFTYLVANQRTDRYRPIARVLYEHHRTFRTMLTTEEIYTALRQMDEFVERFPDYSIEDLEMDLGTMKEWGILRYHNKRMSNTWHMKISSEKNI